MGDGCGLTGLIGLVGLPPYRLARTVRACALPLSREATPTSRS